MGCDGGTIPRRDELVRTKKKPEQKDKGSELSFRWQHCTISQQPLRMPIAACGMGRLYSKIVLLEALLDRTTLPENSQHIKNLKDAKDLKLTPNPAFKALAEKGDGYIDMQLAPYICPVIGLEMNGKFRFVFLWNCGCVMSERALKEIKTKLCHKCQQPFAEEDIVILNGSDEDSDLMTTRMEARQARLKAAKKERSSNRKDNLPSTVTSDQASTVTSDQASTVPLVEASTSGTSKEAELVNGVAEHSGDKKMPVVGARLSVKPNSKLLKRPLNGEVSDPLLKKTKDSYSISKDPKATDVFKSLFTSHRTATQQTKAHWVTYNPFYN